MAARTHRSIPPGPRDERGVLAARILDVARRSFAEKGWAGTSIRGVARDADVDPALVYHYFNSKEQLLDAATTPPAEWAERIQETWATPIEKLGDAIVRNMLRNWESDIYRPFMLAVLLTAADEPRTRDKLSRIIANQLMGPATGHLTADNQLVRAGLVASQLLDSMMMRYVWKVQPLISMDDRQVIAALSPTIQRYLEEDFETA
ncbi:MAG: TetR family transcriptional regulator [Thermomicrobiales bacterium]